jgi:ubiquinone/menaquinone biosynthesis C-methylase UbiE
MKILALIPALLAAAPSFAQSRPDGVFNRMVEGEHEQPGRDEWQQPEKVVATLGLQAGQSVADVGCGAGYFVPYLARAVGRSGRIYAIDIQPEMLALVEQKIARLSLQNVETVLSKETDTQLPEGSVDLALLVDVYAELGAPRALLANLREVLKPEGRLVVIDFKPERAAIAVGPPLSHRLPPRRVIAEVETGGFRLVEQHAFLPYQYFLVFARRGDVRVGQ